MIMCLAFTLFLFSLIRVSKFDVLNCNTYFDKYDQSKVYMRNFLHGQFTRWPGGKIPYHYGDPLTTSQKKIFEEAIKVIEDQTCIRWFPKKKEFNFVNVTTTYPGCFAEVGYNKLRGPHILNLQSATHYQNCWKLGTALHEMLHILGDNHEHTRPDRDNYIKVLWENIYYGSERHFWKLQNANDVMPRKICNDSSLIRKFDDCWAPFKADLFGLPYDYYSIMHYDSKSGSKNHNYTLMKIDGSTHGFGTTGHLSALDILKVKAAYNNCYSDLPTTLGPCEDTNPNCKSWTAYCASNTQTQRECKLTCGICKTTPSPPCMDGNANCPIWKNHCNKTHIFNLCLSTCGGCKIPTESPCVDSEEGCKHWASYCNMPHIKNKCPLKCGVCKTTTITTTLITTPVPCKDLLPACKTIKDVCKSKLFEKKCKETCGMCST